MKSTLKTRKRTVGFSVGMAMLGLILASSGCQKEVKEIRNPSASPALAQAMP